MECPGEDCQINLTPNPRNEGKICSLDIVGYTPVIKLVDKAGHFMTCDPSSVSWRVHVDISFCLVQTGTYTFICGFGSGMENNSMYFQFSLLVLFCCGCFLVGLGRKGKE